VLGARAEVRNLSGDSHPTPRRSRALRSDGISREAAPRRTSVLIETLARYHPEESECPGERW
jgi:hypothetical protein